MTSNQKARSARANADHQAQASEAAVRSTMTEDLVAALLGLGIVVALYSDGRAHVLRLPDSFFTPWHAFLYGGLVLLSAWLAVISRRAAVRHRLARIAHIPAGYGFAVFGAAAFAVGGAADLAWHEVFGIESGIDALLSPTHLWLFVSGVLLVSGPVEAQRRRTGRPTATARIFATLAVTSIAAIAAFALSFYSGFLTDPEHFAVGGAAQVARGSLVVVGLGGYLITTVVLVTPVVFLLRFGLAIAGSVTFLVTVVAALAEVLENFHDLRVVPAAFVAAVFTDAVLAGLRLRGVGLRGQELVLAAALPMLVWPAQLVVKNLGQGVAWSVELVNGIVILSALVSFAVVLALGPNPRREGTDTR
ncbi:hypothetical protein [Pseudarthrobacter sp. S9]|uniref:hypothetical protein n=1 Tax=Pseudarthrobacter sp. S9 TaxID=3418421 RepID=UPI003CFE9752